MLDRYIFLCIAKTEHFIFMFCYVDASRHDINYVVFDVTMDEF